MFCVADMVVDLATWPALWLSDPDNWPTNGEIDVMEQVNQATDGNIMSKSFLSLIPSIRNHSVENFHPSSRMILFTKIFTSLR